MLSSLGIATAVANKTEAVVTLSGRPAGLVRFWASRYDDIAQAEAVPHLGTASYRVQLPHPDLWYLWVQDDQGIGHEHQAVVLENPWADDIGGMISQQLESHRLGLNAYVRRSFAESSMQAIQYGYQSVVTDWPAIVVTSPRWDWEWYGFPYLRQWTYRFTVATLVVRPDESNTLGFAANLATAVTKILSMRGYNRAVTPGGIKLYNVEARTGEAEEVQIDPAHFGAVGSVQWSGKFLLQDTGA